MKNVVAIVVKNLFSEKILKQVFVKVGDYLDDEQQSPLVWNDAQIEGVAGHDTGCLGGRFYSDWFLRIKLNSLKPNNNRSTKM